MADTQYDLVSREEADEQREQQTQYQDSNNDQGDYGNYGTYGGYGPDGSYQRGPGYGGRSYYPNQGWQQRRRSRLHRRSSAVCSATGAVPAIKAQPPPAPPQPTARGFIYSLGQ